MSQKKTFITTTDKETADKLLSEGFQLVSQSGSSYTFLNQSSNNLTFDNIDKKKVAYTSTLAI
jgi:hypothetical protein